MTKVSEILDVLAELAPLSLQADFDNAGFLLGHAEAGVKCVLLALDVTDAVVSEAIERGAELIVSHHPLIFQPARALTDLTPAGRRLLRLAEQGIAVISMHTNLDIASGGVNDVLIELLGAKCEGALEEDGCGRIGSLPKALPLREFLVRCKELLQVEGLRYVDTGRAVQRLAVMGGSGGGSFARAAALGCDTYVTADVKYHQFLDAKELGLNLIDADHFCTEQPVMLRLQKLLSERFPAIDFELSAVHRQTVQSL